MSTEKKNLTDVFKSFNYWDEIAIEQAFGFDFTTMMTAKQSVLSRAALFVDKRHEGMSDADAKKFAFDATLEQLNGLYTVEDDEPMPSDPVTEQGKGDEPSN